MTITRRDLLAGAGALTLGGYAAWDGNRRRPVPVAPPSGRAAVAIVKADSYATALAQRMVEGIRECGLNVRGKSVLLKPNLVEFDPDTCINTNVAVIAAAAEAFRTMGAAHIVIGEGPGHRRDTYALAELAKYRGDLEDFDSLFVDLNRDDVSPVNRFADLDRIYLPNTALRADLIVSLAKMKTHHWAGATLSMKNFFGLVPGNVYGWPKNQLHQVGIAQSIVELNRIFHKSFAIVDGIVGMEGNGPIQGTPKQAGVLVMGSDLPAVDATCCRIMGIDPAKVEYLQMAADKLGIVDEARIDQRGERVASVRTNFQLIKEFHDLRLV